MIRIVQGDSDRIARGGGTGGSRSVTVQTNATRAAVAGLVAALEPFLAGELGAAPEFADGAFRAPGSNRTLTLLEAVALARAAGRDDLTGFAATATLDGRSYPNGAHVAEVEVEIEPTVALSDFEALMESVKTLDANNQDLFEVVEAQAERIAHLEATLNAVAERAERAESLALGQNQVLVRFVAAEEKLEIAEQLIVDLSRRVATVEGIDPADREDMDVRLADLDQRMHGLQRDVGMVARLTMNGSPAAVGGRAPSGQANFDRANGVQLASPVASPENVPNDVAVGDFVNGYGAVLEIFATSDGGRMVVMENGSVILN